MQETQGRRDRKKSDTRDALRIAALRLALEHGYDNVTIEAITEAADVSVRTFFNYFDSKEDAVLGLGYDGGAGVADALAGRPAGEAPVVALRAAFLEMAANLAERQPLWGQRMALVRANPQLLPRLISSFAAFERRIAEGIAARTGCDVETDLYPSVVAAAAAGAMRVAMAQCRFRADEVTLTEFLSSAFDVLVRGLTPPEASTKTGPTTC
ncbi:MAG: TetR/AcrR family transcriptional regulator [Pseudonocardiales bacterium]